ncbi:MAG: hypothetical protein ACHQD8_06390, partial [Chitinophagales bacterium]
MKKFTRVVWLKAILSSIRNAKVGKVFFLVILFWSVSFKGYTAGNYYPTGTPTITGAATYCQNGTASALTCTWNNTTCGSAVFSAITVTVQWYSNTVALNSGGTLIAVQSFISSGAGATGITTYTPITTSAGTLYYYAVVSWSAQGACAPGGSVTSSVSGAVVVNPQPSVYVVTGGGSYCAGGSGVHVRLSGSNSGISYQLYNG